jgi:hypothetical protein
VGLSRPENGAVSTSLRKDIVLDMLDNTISLDSCPLVICNRSSQRIVCITNHFGMKRAKNENPRIGINRIAVKATVTDSPRDKPVGRVSMTGTVALVKTVDVDETISFEVEDVSVMI